MITRSAGVCGAGLMGAGIAQVLATAGCDVVIYDVDPGAVATGLATIEADLDKGVALGKVEDAERAAILSRISPADDLDDFAGVDVVIEAVAETLSVKREVFARLDRICPPPALLLSNTSTLSPTEIADVMEYPERFAGLHFFNPAQRMKLVEILPGRSTSSETVTRVRELAGELGKTSVVANEAPGGIVSRLQLIVRNEAIRLLAEGVATAEDIDTATKLGSGWPMGPIELSDMVGLDIHVNNSDSLADLLGNDAFRPHDYVRRLVAEGNLGRKSGRGFYRYRDGE
jgi:3-hydroxybutyryl-CoA dehydrogenase